MTIAYRGTDDDTTVNSADTLTFTYATAGAVDGDLMFVSIGLDIDTTLTVPSGWTELQAMDHPTTAFNQYLYWKVADSESATEDWVQSANGASTGKLIVFYDTVGGGTFSIEDSSQNNANSATIATTAVTVAAAELLLCTYGCDDSRTISTPPSGMTVVGSLTTVSSTAQGAYYEIDGSTGSITQTCVWSGSEQMGAIAAVAKLTAGGGGISIPVVSHHRRQFNRG